MANLLSNHGMYCNTPLACTKSMQAQKIGLMHPPAWQRHLYSLSRYFSTLPLGNEGGLETPKAVIKGQTVQQTGCDSHRTHKLSWESNRGNSVVSQKLFPLCYASRWILPYSFKTNKTCPFFCNWRTHVHISALSSYCHVCSLSLSAPHSNVIGSYCGV